MIIMLPYQPFSLDKENVVTDADKIVSSFDSIALLINRRSSCASSQLFEIDDISGCHHSFNDMLHTTVRNSPCILLDTTNSFQVVCYLKYEPKKDYQDNEALRSKPMVMLGPHYFDLSSRSNVYISTNTLSQITFQGNFIHGSQHVC
jgi:hypothetical protein